MEHGHRVTGAKVPHGAQSGRGAAGPGRVLQYDRIVSVRVQPFLEDAQKLGVTFALDVNSGMQFRPGRWPPSPELRRQLWRRFRLLVENCGVQDVQILLDRSEQLDREGPGLAFWPGNLSFTSRESGAESRQDMSDECARLERYTGESRCGFAYGPITKQMDYRASASRLVDNSNNSPDAGSRRGRIEGGAG